MEVWHHAALGVVGLLAGIINVIAGGGSLLTLPVMVFIGLPGPVANGTNRVAVVAQNITAVAAFRNKGFSDFRLSLSLALATLPGAIAGAYAGTFVRGALFSQILAAIMIAVLVATVAEERRKARRRKMAPPSTDAATGTAVLAALDRAAPPVRLVTGHILMAVIGIYGGFIQAGVGFLLMAVLHDVMKLDFVRVNMHKVFIVGIFTAAAFLVFFARGQVLWLPALALTIGNAAGGWIGSHLSVGRGEVFIRRFYYATLVAMAAKLLWDSVV